MDQIKLCDDLFNISLINGLKFINGWEERERLDIVSANCVCAVDVTIKQMGVRPKSKSKPFIPSFFFC